MFEIKCNLPEAFSNRDPFSKEITTVYENINILYMPVAPSGHSVIYLSLRNYNVRAFNFEAATKAFFMTLGKFEFIDSLIEDFLQFFLAIETCFFFLTIIFLLHRSVSF